MIARIRVTPAVLLLVAMVAVGFSNSALAQAYTSPNDFAVTITVDENGHGVLTTTNGFNGVLPFALVPDPGPGGLPSVLTYDMLNPPGLVAGDVFMTDADCGGCFLDVIRFNPSSFTGGTGSLVFYSDNLGGFDSIADTFSPPGSFYTNTISIPEVGNESVNFAVYTPLPGQPGFVAGAAGPVTYIFYSDTPEPSTLVLLGSGLLGGIGVIRRRLNI